MKNILTNIEIVEAKIKKENMRKYIFFGTFYTMTNI
jgi:hypothetical protein